jgi:ABC-type multidrug transport system fused ATPase/permease subunit
VVESEKSEGDGLRWAIKRSLQLLQKSDRIRLYLFILFQLFASILDTIGILLVGAMVSIGISVISNVNTNDSLLSILGFIGLRDASQPNSIAILGIATVSLLVFRTILSLFISFHTYRFLARKSAEISAELMKKVFASSFSWVRKQKSQEVSYALTEGVQFGIIGVLSSFVALASESGLLLVTFSVLILVNPLMAVVTVAFFTTFAILIYLHVGHQMSKVTKLRVDASILGIRQVREVIDLFREIMVMSRMEYFASKFKVSRVESARNFADMNWIQQIPRISVEVAIVLGGALLAITAALTSSFENAIAYLILFLAAASRLAPSALRLQQAAISIRGFASSAGAAFYYTQLGDESITAPFRNSKDNLDGEISEDPRQISVEMKDVSFKFDDSDIPTLNQLSLKIPPLEVIALVGPSGAGKSTFCDLILGLHSPSSGVALIGGMPAKEFIRRNPGRIAYLPQEVKILADTIVANIAIGVPVHEVDMEQLQMALESAQLATFVQSQPLGLKQLVGESGLQLSGGQRQRIGLARALYFQPTLLILDEPTSALDAETEDLLMQTLKSLREKCSILIIAHRLSTVRFVDRVIYLEDGKILGDGTFVQVREQVLQFDLQAGLQGL